MFEKQIGPTKHKLNYESQGQIKSSEYKLWAKYPFISSLNVY